jgi:hypothetical protein
MESITRAAKEQVSIFSATTHVTLLDTRYLKPGLYVWVGPGPRNRERTPLPARLGGRFRSLVHLQIPELRTGWNWRALYP